MDNILDQYGGLDRLRPKISVEDAKRETNAGLRSRNEPEHPQELNTVKSRVSNEA